MGYPKSKVALEVMRLMDRCDPPKSSGVTRLPAPPELGDPPKKRLHRKSFRPATVVYDLKTKTLKGINPRILEYINSTNSTVAADQRKAHHSKITITNEVDL